MPLDYVTIKRYRVKDLRGFILAESKKLLALQYTPDFFSDGILILDKRYIYDIQRDRTGEFHTQLMQQFDLIQGYDFSQYDIKNWRTFFQSALPQQPFMMIEDEFTGFDMTYIGKLEKVKKQQLIMHQFSGVGNWDNDQTPVYYDWISLCHIYSNYVNLYEKYFNLTKE